MSFKKIMKGFLYIALYGMSHMGMAAESDGGCSKESYFAPDDADDEFPLQKPNTEFVRTRNAAKKGNPLEQRNLAVSYEGGYLVSRCHEKADYWYRRAAKGGDETAQRWVARQDVFDKLLAGPECYESGCDAAIGNMAYSLSLITGQGGHYYADVTINGITVQGMIDTGATTLSMSAATANRLQIPITGNSAISSTANGNTQVIVKNMPSVKIGSITLSDIAISIRPVDGVTLIGMSVINRLRMVAASGQMTLSK